jgi:hypothetical protein
VRARRIAGAAAEAAQAAARALVEQSLAARKRQHAERELLRASNERRAAEEAECAALGARCAEERRLEAAAASRHAQLDIAAAPALVPAPRASLVLLAARHRRYWAYAASAIVAAGSMAGLQYGSLATASRERELAIAPGAPVDGQASYARLKYSYSLSAADLPGPAPR